MTIIITHGDADGICAASIVKMVKHYKDAEVLFSHPMGLADDLRDKETNLIICDLAIDERAYSEIYSKLEAITANYSIIYLDHHHLPGPLPPKVTVIHQEGVSATEMAFRYFYYMIPKSADRIALIGAICDYLDGTPLMSQLMHHFERRTLFLDAGLLAQGLKQRLEYNEMRKLVEKFSQGMYPCEDENLVSVAIETTRTDKKSRFEVLQKYHKGRCVAWILNPPASKSKAAHWIMGNSGSIIGICIRYHSSKPDIADITIRGRRALDLRTIVPKLAQNMGGSGGGHENAIGCRIPRDKVDAFVQILDNTLMALKIEPPPNMEKLIELPEHAS